MLELLLNTFSMPTHVSRVLPLQTSHTPVTYISMSAGSAPGSVPNPLLGGISLPEERSNFQETRLLVSFRAGGTQERCFGIQITTAQAEVDELKKQLAQHFARNREYSRKKLNSFPNQFKKASDRRLSLPQIIHNRRARLCF